MLKKLLITLGIILILAPLTAVFAEADESTLSGGEIKTMSIQEVADFYKISATEYANNLGKLLNINVSSSDEIQKLHDNAGLEPSSANDIAKSLITNSGTSTEQVITTKKQEKAEEIKNPTKNYYFLEVTIVTLILYLVTWLLSKFKKIKTITHRKIWNYILLFSFVPAGIFGTLLVLKVTYGLVLNFPFSTIYWHVIGGTMMAEISILHILWHLNYFLPKKLKTLVAR